MAHESPATCPYAPGKTISLMVENERQAFPLDVTIIETFEPFTMSCAMLVQVKDGSKCVSLGRRGRFVLKMYNRRFAHGLREHVTRKQPHLTSWNSTIEEAYRSFAQTRASRSFFKELSWTYRPKVYWLSFPSDDGGRKIEAYIQYLTRKAYTTEAEVYRRLHDIQGIDIPHFLGRCSINVFPDNVKADERFACCPGILLDFIPGFKLSDLANHGPKEPWQGICDEAIQVVNRIGDHGLLNTDTKPRNFIVTQDQDTGQLKPVMIDFAACQFREEHRYKRDYRWRYLKAHEDEEGAIGVVMERKLEGAFHYRPTSARMRLVDEFMREGVDD